MNESFFEDLKPLLAAKSPFALARVIETWGSSPRPVGAMMAIKADGHMIGSVSGGCVEAAVVMEAQDCLQSGHSKILSYGVTNDEAIDVGLACGGTIRLAVSSVTNRNHGLTFDHVERIASAQAGRRNVILETDLQTWQHRLIADRDLGHEPFATLLRSGRSKEIDQRFYHLITPNPRLFIVGGVHIAQALSPMAKLAGYAVTIIDPRTSFANPTRFPDTEILNSWPEEALADLGLDASTAVVTLTHDAKLDTPALAAALSGTTQPFYIGALGSKRTHAKRLDALKDQGFGEDDLGNLHGPVGLDIGSSNVAEIAVSILAEITHVRRKGG